MVEEFDGGFSGRGGRGGGRGRGDRADKDWTKGSVIGNLWSLSWPMTISTTIRMMGPTIDLIWIGKLGTAALAGVGVATMLVMLVNSARMGLQTGTRAMIARFMGADDIDGANHVAQQAFVISIVFSVIIAAIGIFLAETTLSLLGLEADVIKEGAVYMRIQFVGMVFMSFWMLSQGIMEASGDVMTPMRITIGTRFLHLALSPMLIFGWWIFPRLGVAGAALANIADTSVAVIIALWILFSGRSRLRPTMKGFHFDGSMIWRIVKIGIPASITGMERSMANVIVMWFVVPFGTFAVAAHSLMNRVGMFIRMPAMGMGRAAGILAGQNLGAGEPERAERTGWLSAWLYTGFMVVVSVAVWFGAEHIIRIFNPEPELVQIGATFLRIEIVGYLVFGFVMVLMNCLNGVGETMVPMLTTLISMWGVQVPAAYLLTRFTNLGVNGVRWGLVSGIVIRAVIFATYFKMGRWKDKKI
ncbi:MAG: MATE family efflux transporter [Dehalococcoidales bacterium]